jgi:TRAP-type mannitol/chloroaromatic compound transport system permease small subunit
MTIKIFMPTKIASKIEAFVDLTGRTVSWLALLMVIVTFVVVVLRYLFDIGSIALQESVTYMHATLFLIGAAWTLKHDAHVRVDIIYNRCSIQSRALIDLLGSVFLLMPLMLFIAWISWVYILDSWSVHEGSREAGGLPGVFLLKSLILVMAALLVLQAIANALNAFATWRGRG